MIFHVAERVLTGRLWGGDCNPVPDTGFVMKKKWL